MVAIASNSGWSARSASIGESLGRGYAARDLRDSVRRACRYGAVVRHNDRTITGVVENISASGCRAKLAEVGPAARQSVLIEIAELHLMLDGMVVWRRGFDVGIRFGYTLQSRLRRY